MRKQPRQGRSRATVEAVLAAGARILSESGWLALTTNRAAEVAGVSIGSLYQYFPNKAALTEAITRRHYDEVLGVLQTIDEALTIEENAARLVAGMIRIHGVEPGLHHVLLHDVPAGDGPDEARAAFEAEYLRRYEALVARSGNDGAAAGMSMAAQILAAGVAGAIHDAARRGTLTAPAFAPELVKLILSFISMRSSVEGNVTAAEAYADAGRQEAGLA